MLLRIASDLHLEGFGNRNIETLAIDFLPKDDRDLDAVLVLAGDISSNPEQLLGFLAVVEKQFKHVFYVPGNHEAYKHNFQAWNLTMRDRFNQHLKNTSAVMLDEVLGVEYDGVRFIMGTLWGDCGPTLKDRDEVGLYLNDFRLIGWGEHSGKKITVPRMVELNAKAKKEIRARLKEPFSGKTVVISHHLPTRKCVSARFWPYNGSDGANGGFASNCDDMLAGAHRPALWIHGHTHDTIDMQLPDDGTRIVCNPAGYRGEWFSTVNTFMTTDKDGPCTRPKFVEL